MKSQLLFTSVGLLALLATPAGLAAQGQNAQLPHYAVTDLGPAGNPFSQATYVNNQGLVTGLDTAPDGTQHAVLWPKGQTTPIDISTPGLGGPNSGAFGVNERGQVEVQAESLTTDPYAENFCAYGTGFTCLPAVWQHGVMTQLPLLGGNNGTLGQINSRGEVAGIAENSTVDPECPSTPAINGTGPYVLDFEAVIWRPRQGQVRELRPLPGDSVGMAIWINDQGQAVGTSGSCANTYVPPIAAGPHAVLWDKDGSPIDLGSLGGTANPAVLGVGNIGLAINNRTEVVGVSALPGSTSFHAFLWNKKTGMQDLGVLSGDTTSAGLGINNKGEVVGATSDSTGSPRAFYWKNGAMHDLNDLAPQSPLYLLVAFDINETGDIAGFGVETSTGDVHGFLATPCNANSVGCADVPGAAAEAGTTHSPSPRPMLSESAREQLQKRVRFGLSGLPLGGQQ